MMDLPNLKQIEIKTRIVRPGVTLLKFKNFEDMGGYYMNKMEEFEAKKIKIVTVGVAMFLIEQRSI